jgi:putative DNA primase/helicase
MTTLAQTDPQINNQSDTPQPVEGCKLGRELTDCPLKRVGCGSLYDALLYITPPWSIREYVHEDGVIVDDSFAPDFRTDLGNGRRFVRQHGQNVRYVKEWEWLVWNGKAWEQDQTGAVMRLAKKTALSIFDEAKACMRLAEKYQDIAKAAAEANDLTAAEKATDQASKLQKTAKELNAWALTSQGAARLEAMVKLAKSEFPIPARPEDFDKDPWLFNCNNCTVDLRSGKQSPHRREDMITKLCPVDYDPQAICPTWQRALLQWMDNKQHMAEFLQRLVGYSMTGDVSEQKLPFLYGLGSNGKSTFVITLLAMLGKAYSTQAAPDLLTAGRDAHPTEVADLRGMRLVASIEVEDGKKMAENLVKQLTGGDKLKARFMRQDFFTFEPTHKILLVANHKPVITGTDHAIWRRVMLIPFTVTIADGEKDPRLPAKLQSELPGILAWAIRGCLDWQERGLQIPDEVRAATEEYKAESDILATFLDECTVKVDDAKIKAGKLYLAWKAWCEANGHNSKNGTWFGKEIAKRGYTKEQNYLGIFYQGIGLAEGD